VHRPRAATACTITDPEERPVATNVAERLLDVLVLAGVKRVYGIPGDAVNVIIDALRRDDRLDFVGVRHEETGAFAAAAQAKLTGELAAVVGTSGPGAVHLLNGLYDAKLDHAPVIAITGQVAGEEQGAHGHQEVDQHRLFEDVTLSSQTLVDPAQLPRLAVQACQIALADRGVVHLAVPADLADADVPDEPLHGIARAPRTTAADPDQLRRAVEVLDGASKPVILAGIGVRDAVDDLLELADRIGAPIVKTLVGKALFADDHPLTTGGLGLLGTRPSVDAVEGCDVLVMAGTDFPYRDFLPDDVPVIQIERDPGHVGRRAPVSHPLIGDAVTVLPALRDAVARHEDRSWLEQAQDGMRRWRRWMRRLETDDDTPIKPARLAAVVGAHLDDDAVVVCDTGAVTAWTARHLAIRGGQDFTLSGNLASMAYGLPAAIGAQLTFPDRQVVALVGDGSFTMLPSDLITASELQLPLTVVVFDDAKLGLITVEQQADAQPDQETAIPGRDLADIARAFGAHAVRVERLDDLEGALASSLRTPGPSVVDVVIDPDELIIPPKIETARALGFAQAKVKEFFGYGQSEGGFGVVADVLR
jgi:pyruvate oxidase